MKKHKRHESGHWELGTRGKREKELFPLNFLGRMSLLRKKGVGV